MSRIQMLERFDNYMTGIFFVRLFDLVSRHRARTRDFPIKIIGMRGA